MPEETPPANNNASNRRRILLILALVFALAGGAYGLYWMLVGRYHESTDDAYVAGNLIRVVPRVSGTVMAVYVDDTSRVERGQVLARLDDADAKIALADAESSLGSTVREVAQLFSAAEQSRANVAIKEESLRQAEADAARRAGNAAADEAISREEQAHTTSALVRARDELKLADSQLAGAEAQVANTDIERHPKVLEASAKVREAYLDLERCEIRAAEAGFIAKRAVQVGQQVTTGTPLMTIVPLNQIWAEANFKEDQLQNMRIGQPVVLVSDIYGSGVKLHGKVVGLAAGTGSVFSLLPPQNASGNWIKIVQRLPVRIALDRAEVEKYPLRIGLSMKVEVETSDTSGTALAKSAPDGALYETMAFESDEKKAAQHIRDIIAANLGHAKEAP